MWAEYMLKRVQWMKEETTWIYRLPKSVLAIFRSTVAAFHHYNIIHIYTYVCLSLSKARVESNILSYLISCNSIESIQCVCVFWLVWKEIFRPAMRQHKIYGNEDNEQWASYSGFCSVLFRKCVNCFRFLVSIGLLFTFMSNQRTPIRIARCDWSDQQFC